jgi:DNA adenine methylase
LKSLLRYPGGKTRALKHIIPYFPKDLAEMVSPFFGGGSIEIHYAARGARVHGYDIFEPLANFWQQVLQHPKGLSNILEKSYHPCSKEEFYQYQEEHGFFRFDAIERAAMFYTLNRSSFSGATMSGGHSKEAAEKRFTQSSIARLRNFVCPSLTVEQADFTDSLRRHDDETFIYADPPYLLEKSTLYGERGSTHKDFDHQRFAEEIKKKNNWVISYNPHPEILELYKDYEIVYPEWAYGMSSDKKSKEILILNVKEEENE